jgi:predicted RNA methylase
MRMTLKYLWFLKKIGGENRFMPTNLQDFERNSLFYEDSLSFETRKEKGIFYTDIFMAECIVKFLRIPEESIIFDPCCGTGSFLFAAKSLGQNNLYGADTDKKAVKICRTAVDAKTIKCIDTLSNKGVDIIKKMGMNSNADYIIGNPPYVPISKSIIIDTQDYLFLRNVKDSGSNLFVAALYRAFELAKPKGIISYIIPKNFLHVMSYSLLRKTIIKNKQIQSIIDIGAYFKHVRGEQIVLTIKNEYKENNSIDFYKFEEDVITKCTSVSQDFFHDEIFIFDNELDYNIYNKLSNTYQKFENVCTGYVGRGKSTESDAITGKQIKKFGFKHMDVPGSGNKVFMQNIYSAEAGIIASFAGQLEASETVTVFTDGDEKMCFYIVGILHSRLCNYFLLKFCYNKSKLTMHVDAKYLKKIPLIRDEKTFDKIVNAVKALETIDYMCGEWFEMVESLNDLVYEAYQMNSAERDFINKEVKKLQSRKWDSDGKI